MTTTRRPAPHPRRFVGGWLDGPSPLRPLRPRPFRFPSRRPARRARQGAGERIVAVGDLHGDYGAWIDIARSAGLIDAKNRWAGGSAILVQTGDITDRGPDSLKIIRHLRKLEKKATKAGGRVIVLIGNHEAMNVTGDLRYVDPGEFAAFRDAHNEALRQAAWDANG